MTDVSIRLRIGCNSQMPKVGRPNFNRSTTVGTTGSSVILVSNAADFDDVADNGKFDSFGETDKTAVLRIAFENPAILWPLRTNDNPRRQRKKTFMDGRMLATYSRYCTISDWSTSSDVIDPAALFSLKHKTETRPTLEETHSSILEDLSSCSF